MYRIGILGSENSHAMAFAEIFNGVNEAYRGEFEDIRVTGVFGTDAEANRKVFEKGGLEFIAESPEDMLGRVDAVMVTARDGKYHFPYARPFLEKGMPAFIDKPFTRSVEEAEQMIALARKTGSQLIGGSGVKLMREVAALKKAAQEQDVLGGDITAPVNMENPYGGFWFYSAHLVECCLTVFGEDPEWVFADRNGGVTAIVHYPRYDVTCHFLPEAYHYAGTVCAKSGLKTAEISLDGIYAEECRGFARMLRTGKAEGDPHSLVMPVAVLAAMEKSFETGKPEKV